MQISRKYNKKLIYLGSFFSLSLFLIGGLESTVLGKWIIFIPVSAIMISVLGLIKSEKKDLYAKSWGFFSLFIGIIYLFLYFALNMYK